MPRGPKGERRPADAIGNAVKVMRIATDEEPDDRDRAAHFHCGAKQSLAICLRSPWMPFSTLLLGAMSMLAHLTETLAPILLI